MSDLRQELRDIRERIKSLHESSHKLIFMRTDLSQTLNTSSQLRLEELDEEAQALFDRISSIERQLKGERFRKRQLVDLTDKENAVLTAIVEAHPGFIKVRDIVKRTGLKRNRVYECLRSFVVAGFIEHQSLNQDSVDGYILTDDGYDFLINHAKIES